jgi:two-component system OmpR family sensor kinase
MNPDRQPPASRLERHLATLEGLLALDAIEIRATLDRAALLIANVLGTDKIDVFLYQPENQTLVALGVSPTEMGQQQIRIGLDRQPLANGGRGAEVFRTGQPYLSGHVDQDDGELVGIREGLGVRSEMIVPLEVNGERRGVLAANSKTPEAFSEEDLQFLGSVTRWVGLVMHRTELTEEVARQARERGRREALEELIGRLSPREQEVAALVMAGLSNAQIGRRLSITEGTAANHIRSIILKLDVPNRARVAAIMAQLGIELPGEDGTEPK